MISVEAISLAAAIAGGSADPKLDDLLRDAQLAGVTNTELIRAFLYIGAKEDSGTSSVQRKNAARRPRRRPQPIYLREESSGDVFGPLTKPR